MTQWAVKAVFKQACTFLKAQKIQGPLDFEG